MVMIVADGSLSADFREPHFGSLMPLGTAHSLWRRAMESRKDQNYSSSSKTWCMFSKARIRS